MFVHSLNSMSVFSSALIAKAALPSVHIMSINEIILLHFEFKVLLIPFFNIFTSSLLFNIYMFLLEALASSMFLSLNLSLVLLVHDVTDFV